MALLLGKVLVIEAEGASGWEEFRKAVADKLEKLRFHSFRLTSRVKGIENFEWKPAHPKPWNVESAEWVELSRSLQVGTIIVGEFTLFGYVEEDFMDHFDRIADVFGEAIEDAFQVCHRKFVT